MPKAPANRPCVMMSTKNPIFDNSCVQKDVPIKPYYSAEPGDDR